MMQTLDYELPETASPQRRWKLTLWASSALAGLVVPAACAMGWLLWQTIGYDGRPFATIATFLLIVGVPLVAVVGIVGYFAVTAIQKRNRLTVAFIILWWLDVVALTIAYGIVIASARPFWR